jgi:hypothetical protein
VRLHHLIVALAALGAVASAFKCTWFFFFFSRNMGGGQLAALTLYLPLVVAPYIFVWLAARLSTSVNLLRAILVVVVLCLLGSALYYLDGLPKVQDGEFGFVFLLTIPQSLLAVVVLLAALWIRWGKQASNSSHQNGPAASGRPLS